MIDRLSNVLIEEFSKNKNKIYRQEKENSTFPKTLQSISSIVSSLVDSQLHQSELYEYHPEKLQQISRGSLSFRILLPNNRKKLIG